ncbi:MAG: DUF4339 domain-containing protein [Verrucomicrobiota bacterium]
MYKIIGADHKEYGPITAEQLRYWISEGRVNAQTQARADGTNDWKPLGQIPEFAEALGLDPVAVAAGNTPSTGYQSNDSREQALNSVKGPSIGLKVTAGLGMLAVLIGLVLNVCSLAGIQLIPQNGDPQFQKVFSQLSGGIGIFQNLIGAAIAVVIWMAASHLDRLEKHQFVVTGSILALLPCLSPCCLFGLPFGIWALVVINKPEIKRWFR